MGRAADSQRAVEQAAALRRVCDALGDPRERRRLMRVERQLRHGIGVGVPKQRAAALLGISLPALQKWIDRDEIPTVRRPGSSRVEVDTDALVELVAEVRRLREEGRSRGVVAEAIRSLKARGRLLRRLRPNETAAELRHAFRHSTPLDRLREANELSYATSVLAGRGAESRARREKDAER